MTLQLHDDLIKHLKLYQTTQSYGTNSDTITNLQSVTVVVGVSGQHCGGVHFTLVPACGGQLTHSPGAESGPGVVEGEANVHADLWCVLVMVTILPVTLKTRSGCREIW